MKKVIIGLSGKKRSGKDTAAQSIKAMLAGVTEICYFADGVKQGAAAILGLQPDHFYNDEAKKAMFIVGYGEYGEPCMMSGRAFLQKFGTECIRNNINQQFWVTRTMLHIESVDVNYVIIPDVRFPNEYNAIQEAGGIVVRVQRYMGEDIDEHPSETALDDYHFDAYIDNNGSYLSEKFIKECEKICVMIENGGNENVGQGQAGI